MGSGEEEAQVTDWGKCGAKHSKRSSCSGVTGGDGKNIHVTTSGALGRAEDEAGEHGRTGS